MSIRVGPYHLSPELFIKRKLRKRCGEEACHAACCAQGVFLTLYDAQRIVARGDAIQPYLRESFDFAQWDLSRPSYITTPVLYSDTPQEQCWFLRENKLCAIHSYALDQGIAVNEIKPYFCRLFPLTLVDLDVNLTEIGVDQKAYDTCLVESDQETTLYVQFETELRRLIGNECYAELSALVNQ